jgi:hypothetical protein
MLMHLKLTTSTELKIFRVKIDINEQSKNKLIQTMAWGGGVSFEKLVYKMH